MEKPLIANELSSLPLDYIISAPMLATINAQGSAARATYDFIREIGFVKTDNFSESSEMNMVNFSFNTLDKLGESKNQLSVPLLSLVKVPFLRIAELDIDFEFNIKETKIDKSKIKTKTEVDLETKGFLWIPKIEMNGTVITSNETESSVKKHAVLKIHVKSVQDKMPEGLEKILDIFGSIVDKQARNLVTPDNIKDTPSKYTTDKEVSTKL